MYKQIDAVLEGVAPLILHSNRGINPIDPMVLELKRWTSKRSKTEDDHKEIARLEWAMGMYTNEAGRPVIPGENIESMLVAAAKKHKLGPKAKAGILCDGTFEIEYDGPKNLDGMWKDGRFTDQRPVCVQRARLIRTRPIFRAWRLPVSIHYRGDQLDGQQVLELLETAGSIVGLGDYRPRFGRFDVVA